MAARFTIICEFRGGTYIAQVVANEVREAQLLWIEHLARERPIPRCSTHLAKSLAARDADVLPVALAGLQDVWCFTSQCGGDLMLANIVASALEANGS